MGWELFLGIGLVLIIWLLVSYLVIKAFLWRRAKKDMYLCVDFFIRNLHEQSFYHPERHHQFTEYLPVYRDLKKRRSKWYFNQEKRDEISHFLITFEHMNDFVSKVSSYMGDEHYFAYSEFLECKKSANLDELESYLDDDFLRIVNNHELYSYSQIEKYLDVLHGDFSDVPKTHNRKVIEKELADNKEFFDTVMKYPLDQQQRESIVKLEDNTLVVSSAGSGKTSTTVGKVKYLVERKGTEPHRILPLAFAKKAADELTERLGYKNKGLTCYTFHSLAFKILDETNQKKPNMCGEELMLQCFYHQAKTNLSFRNAINEFLTEKASLTKNLHEYKTGEEFVADRALYGIQAPYLDMDDRIVFTKSEEEKKICTFLSANGINFRYEAPFPVNTATKFRRQYMPDFTIWFKKGAQWYYLILEHFGVDANGNVPKWFGEGKAGGFEAANREYREGMQWKRKVNSHYKTILIETTSAMFHDGTVYKRLTDQLNFYGVPMKPLTEEEKFDKLVVRNKKMEDSLLQLIKAFITLMKANKQTIDDVFNKIQKLNTNNRPFIDRAQFMLYEIFKPVYENYQLMLEEKDQVDFTDLILMATDLCKERKYKEEYDYILVDEFQDISIDRFNFLQSLRRQEPLTKLYCVGDDWQSIFRFTGSDLTLFSRFEDYFGFTERCKIETTYRFGNPLVKKSSEFILKNELQVKKDIHPFNVDMVTDIDGRSYSDKEGNSQWDVICDIVSTIPSNESIMMISRYHSDASFIPVNNISERDGQRNVVKAIVGDRVIPFNTVHSAKGLEKDHVILVNCSQDGNGFPSKVIDDPILGYVLSQPENYPFAEERRLFYVAITRAKKHTYILYKDTCPSPFIADLFSNRAAKGIMSCPMCKQGVLRSIKEGENQYSKWRLYACTNNTSGCIYTWFVNYQNETEIAKQFSSIARL